MNQVWITKTAAVTALADNLETLYSRLIAGQTAIKLVNRFPVFNYNAKIAACIEDLPSSGYQSMLHTLLDYLFADFGVVPADSFLITASTKSGIDNFERLCRNIPADSGDILPSYLPDIISRRLGLNSKGINICAACASSTIAAARGALLIASGKVETVLVCCLDLVTEFVLSGFSSLQALSPEPCRPFDSERNGLTLGEGAAAILLMNENYARKNRRICMGRIMGWGVSNDAAHITAPAKDGAGLIQAVHRALKVANLDPEDVAAISAHGTGTRYNDMMELTAFNYLFGDRRFPIHSVKGAIGHTLGAAGGIEIALCLEMLSKQTLLPTAGFSSPETGTKGRVSSSSMAISGDCMLTTNSGFGGVNAAIVLGKGKHTFR